MAEAADHARDFPGIGALPDRPIRIILAPTRETYDSLTRGRLTNPVALPGENLPKFRG